LAQLAQESKLAAAFDLGMTGHDLLDQGGSGTRQAHDENGLGHVGSRFRSRQPVEILTREELFETSVQRFHGIRLILQPATLGSQLAFRGDEVLPCVVVALESLEQFSACELTV